MRLLPILVGAGLAAAAVAGGLVFTYTQQITAIEPGAEAPIELRIAKGLSRKGVGHELVKQGLVRNLTIWRVYLRLHPEAPAPKAGRHALSKSMDLGQILVALAQKPLSDDQPLTMVEGWRLSDADEALAKAGKIKAGAYQRAASQVDAYDIAFAVEGTDLAGYLLPETYMMPPGPLDVKNLVQRQLDAFFTRFVKPNEEAIEASGRSLRQIVIMASLLEREEPNPENRPMVAGVLYNRLDAEHPLGVDATSRFGLDDWSNRRLFLAKLRDPNDPYNTRLRPGLPPGPIGAPSLDALNAALKPKKNAFWYYLHDQDAKIHFAKNAKEHEANRHRYNVW